VIKTRRRLVEEDDARPADERHGQVEPAPHATRVGRRQLVRRVGQVELLEQRDDAGPAGGATEVSEVAHQAEVLGAGEQVVDGRELTRHADGVADRVGVPGDVVARHVRLRRRERATW
jgi:hypothetical protein